MASVQKIIEQLSQLDPEQNIIVEWWAKEFAEEYALDRTLTDEQWDELVDHYENGIGIGDEFAETLQLIVSDELDWDEDEEDE